MSPRSLPTRVMSTPRVPARAFTLIELLIVVAIIAILAAIAVPNFLEAQVRAKVSRGHSDMRSMAIALESYRTDHNWYPLTSWYSWNAGKLPNSYSGNTTTQHDSYYCLTMLTTPVAYTTSLGRHPFWPSPPGSSWPMEGYEYADPYYVAAMRLFPDWANGTYGYKITENVQWRLTSPGPTQMYWSLGLAYDPSNGTVSPGVIIRMGP